LNSKIFYTVIVLLLFGQLVIAQNDTIIVPKRDSVYVSYTDFKLSKDSLDAEVDCSATDTMWYELKDKKIHLIKNAEVKYKTIDLKADYIVFDWNSNLLHANGRPDSSGTLAGKPEFDDGQQKFKARELKYNFKTKKGIVYDVTTKENDIYVLGSKAKFITTTDTLKKDNYVYNKNAIITTCDAPIPHYGIYSKTQKVVPNKLAVVGPSVLMIGDVPTPLVLPFAFFPLARGQRAGLILPRDYENSETWGFGLRDIGYYFPVSQYMDVRLTGDIYFRGSWALNSQVRYTKRYKYNGNVNLAYSNRVNEIPGSTEIESNKSYSIRWSHNQDAKANPSIQFGGNLNIESNNFQRTNYNDAQSVLTNSLSSNLNFTKRFTGTSSQLTASLSHSQNTNTRDVLINFPVLGFQTGSIYPFKSKEGAIGKEPWYEKIYFTYDASARNELKTKDTTLFTSQSLKDLKYGVRQSFSTSYNTNVFKYFNISPSVRYEEVWNFDHVEKNFDPSLIVDTVPIKNSVGDTIDYQYNYTYGKIVSNRVNGFLPFRTVSASLSLNTQIFGTIQMKKGLIRGLRHVIKPSISMNYSPAYNTDTRIFKYVDSDSRPAFNVPQAYSVFETSVFGGPPNSGQALSLNYGLNNIFEGKYYSKRDSTVKKFKIFDNINISGNYNFSADSLKWSRINYSGTARFFKGLTTLTISGSFDPYDKDKNGRSINTFYYKTKGKLLRFVSASFRFNTSLTMKQIFESSSKKPGPSPTPIGKSAMQELFENMFIQHTFNLTVFPAFKGDTVVVSEHNIDMNGSIPISKGWKIDVGRIGYDLISKKLTYPDFGFYRDLHCWEMGMNWQPDRGTYSFYLRVKPSSLDFINVPYRKSNQDATFF